MLNPANLSPQAQQMLYAQGAKPGVPLQAPELSKLLQKSVDTDHNQQVSDAEGTAVGFTKSDLNLINQELKSAPPLNINLTLQDSMMLVKFPDKPSAQPPASGPNAPRNIFTTPAPTEGPPAPAAAPGKHLVGNDTVSLDSQPMVKPNADPNRPDTHNLDGVSFKGQGNFGPVSLGTQVQVDSEGKAQGSATTLNVAAGPALQLGATIDTQSMVKDGVIPKQLDLSGKGTLGRVSYGGQMTYTGAGVTETRGNLGVKIADPLSITFESGQQKNPDGSMGIKDIGLGTSHQIGPLSLNSKVRVDTTTGKASVGGGLGIKITPAASLNINGETNGGVPTGGLNLVTPF